MYTRCGLLRLLSELGAIATPLCLNQIVRFLNDADLRSARNVGRLMAEDLIAAGITANCVPVLDVPQPGAHEVIGSRAYSDRIEQIMALARAHAAGAREAGYVMLRLPLEVEDIFSEWLLAHFPDRYRHVMSLVRGVRDGKAYDSSWGKRMTGTGPYAWVTGRRFEIAAAKAGLNLQRTRLRTDLFVSPRRGAQQLSLF